MKLKALILVLLLSGLVNAHSKTWQIKSIESPGKAQIIEFVNSLTSDIESQWEAPNDLVIIIKDKTEIIILNNKEYLLTYWTQGHSGSLALRIFDPTHTSDPLVYEKASTSDFAYKIKDGAVFIKYYNDKSKEDATEVEREDVFKP